MQRWINVQLHEKVVFCDHSIKGNKSNFHLKKVRTNCTILLIVLCNLATKDNQN